MFSRRAFLDVRAMAQLAWMTEYAPLYIRVGYSLNPLNTLCNNNGSNILSSNVNISLITL
jgi:hypothetical protein